MPPSGYTSEQADSIINFLVSCSKALEKEAVGNGLSLTDALRKEVENINQIIASNEFGDVSNIILELTKWFYNEIINKAHKSFEEYSRYVEELAVNAKKDILHIHVPSIVESKSK